MARLIRKLIRDRRGATAIEYGLIVAMIVIVIVAAISKLGGTNGGVWTNFSTKVGSALPS